MTMIIMNPSVDVRTIIHIFNKDLQDAYQTAFECSAIEVIDAYFKIDKQVWVLEVIV